MPTCTQCKSELAETEFSPNRAKRNGLASWCKRCSSARASLRMAQRRADPIEHLKVLDEKRRHRFSDKGREWKRQYSRFHDNHKRRGRGLPFNWSQQHWYVCLEQWD